MKTKLLLLLSFACTIGFAQTTNSLHEKSKAVLTCFEKKDFTGITKYFDETMKKQLPPEKLKEVWTSINQQAGNYLKYTTIVDSIYQQNRIVIMTCVFQNGKLTMKTIFDKSDKVAGLWFLPINGPICSKGYHEKAKATLACFEKGDFVGATKYFDEAMKKQLPPEKLKEVWNMLNQQAGTYIKSSVTEDTIYQQYRIVYITCIFQNQKLKMKAMFDTDCMLAGLFFVPENAPKP